MFEATLGISVIKSNSILWDICFISSPLANSENEIRHWLPVAVVRFFFPGTHRGIKTFLVSALTQCPAAQQLLQHVQFWGSCWGKGQPLSLVSSNNYIFKYRSPLYQNSNLRLFFWNIQGGTYFCILHSAVEVGTPKLQTCTHCLFLLYLYISFILQ